VVLGAAVGIWIGGFDLIYACQDVESDRENGVRCVPAPPGVAPAGRGGPGRPAASPPVLGVWCALTRLISVAGADCNVHDYHDVAWRACGDVCY
ncbi:hypothetical protein VM98_37040, partial [Streptomyces rubellomurinus subsp. indigoferus]